MKASACGLLVGSGGADAEVDFKASHCTGPSKREIKASVVVNGTSVGVYSQRTQAICSVFPSKGPVGFHEDITGIFTIH